jgi:hypothetical protein
MMAFIEQEAKEKAEEIDAKVRISESHRNKHHKLFTHTLSSMTVTVKGPMM